MIVRAQKTPQDAENGLISLFIFFVKRQLFDTVRIGGITIDGKLAAFSIGMLNPRENMAVIGIEKADPDINGLYQMINREFLLHEFPEAELINREDDAGVPGLRRAKMSYKPLMFENRFRITEKEPHFMKSAEEPDRQ